MLGGSMREEGKLSRFEYGSAYLLTRSYLPGKYRYLLSGRVVLAVFIHVVSTNVNSEYLVERANEGAQGD